MTANIPVLSASRPDAFEAFLSHLPLLRRWVKSKAPRFVDSEDVIQQTLLQALRHCGTFRFDSSPGTWLCTIAINHIRACARHPGSTRLTFEDPRKLEAFSTKDPHRSPLAELEREEAERELHRAIAKLPKIDRKIIELRDFQGLSTRETSDRLSISTTAVKSRHHRARGRLHKFLQAKRSLVQ